MSTSEDRDARWRRPVDANVGAVLIFACVAICAELGVLVALQVWPSLGDKGLAAMAAISAIFGATMTTVGIALYRGRSNG